MQKLSFYAIFFLLLLAYSMASVMTSLRMSSFLIAYYFVNREGPVRRKHADELEEMLRSSFSEGVSSFTFEEETVVL